MPTIDGRTLWVLSDYSFDNPASAFDVVGILVADAEALGNWKQRRDKVRSEILGDGRRMNWKDLNSDTRRQAAFFPFLEAADFIPGLSVALSFQRSPVFRIPNDQINRFKSSFELTANWKPKNIQQMFRIAYCTAMLVAGLSSPGQNVHWVTDQDPAFANETREKDTVSVLAKLLGLFLPHKLGEIRYGTTGDGEEPLFQEDLIALPDLMCGATCELLTSIKREYEDIPKIYSKLPRLSARPSSFLQWYANGNWPLKRYICCFESRAGQPPAVGILHPKLMCGSSVSVP